MSTRIIITNDHETQVVRVRLTTAGNPKDSHTDISPKGSQDFTLHRGLTLSIAELSPSTAEPAKAAPSKK